MQKVMIRQKSTRPLSVRNATVIGNPTSRSDFSLALFRWDCAPKRFERETGIPSYDMNSASVTIDGALSLELKLEDCCHPELNETEGRCCVQSARLEMGRMAWDDQGADIDLRKRWKAQLPMNPGLMLPMTSGWTICHDRQIGNEPNASQETAVENGAM
ncbi:hypothetical protein BDP67DRAFT_488829 [Colletotrichum lupini]|nr:hypothetical protein BDP67DRAFT_488829 [Colletotrichum lupini]